MRNRDALGRRLLWLAGLLFASSSCGPCSPPTDEHAPNPAASVDDDACGLARPGDRYTVNMLMGLTEEREVLAVQGEGFEVKRTMRRSDGSQIGEKTEVVTRASTFGEGGRTREGREFITVGGCTFACDVYTERSEKADGGKLDARWWVSQRYPYVIKSVINGVVAQELTAIDRASK